MKEADLRRVLAALSIEPPTEPNHSGWMHSACPFAPWKHKNGIDRSKGFALKAEDKGVSAYSCPACKSHGRIENLARELGSLRQQDYSGLIAEITRLETLGAVMLPSWENRFEATRAETLGDPLDLHIFNPVEIFDPIGRHPAAVDFVRSRRVSFEAVQKAGMRFDPDKGRIVFPVYDGKGQLYGFTGRTILPPERLNFVDSSGRHVQVPKVMDYAGLKKRMLILGEHLWETGRPTIIVEGLFAYARFLTEGVDQHYNVGAILGSEMTPGKAAILHRWGLPVYLILDNDAAGEAGLFGRLRQTGTDHETGEPILTREPETGALALLVRHIPVYIPNYPEDVVDPDDLSFDQIMAMCASCPPSFY